MRRPAAVFIFILIASMMSTIPVVFAVAGPTDYGAEAFERGDYAEAYRIWSFMAGMGDARAQYNLGSMFYRGKGVVRNNEEAMKWFLKAAEQGYVDAQSTLGYLFDTGMGGALDDAQAMKWYSKAAEQGDAFGQLKLGEMYLSGHGISQDYDEALKWIRKSAEQGYADGLLALGVMHTRGEGLKKDYVQAYMCITLSQAIRTDKEREKRSKEYAIFFEFLDSHMTQEQIAEAKRLVREWKPKKEK